LVFRTLLALLLVMLAALPLGGCANRTATAAGADGGRARAIQNKGSDTMVNLALAWAEAYRAVAPDVDIAVTGGGSGTGIAALINGTVDIANASRAMKENEIADAQQQGINPVEHTVAIDAIAIIVNQRNPVAQLTIAQLGDIFSGRITNWRELGGEDAPIVLVSRESNSGTHVYFLEEVLRQGNLEDPTVFAPQTLLMPSSVGITSEVQRNPHAIGYDGLGYVDPSHEKIIGVAEDPAGPYVIPTVETGADGTYPISRPLYVYSTGIPDPAIDAYLAWIQGPEGQAIVADLGFVPITQE
jgi:phosphate transport system substrate-binding protein